jgi:hypothetical protein
VDDQTLLASSQPKATLIVREGTQVGTTFPLVGEALVLGREEEVDIPIHDPEVSRRHASITWQSGGYVLEDLGSTNGTYLNGVKLIGPQPLKARDRIGMGQTVLEFQPQPEAVAAAHPATAPMPVASPSPPPSPDVASEEEPEGRSRCLLWGCGCLVALGVLLMIAAVLAMVLFAEDIQPIFDDLGIPIQLVMVHAAQMLV